MPAGAVVSHDVVGVAEAAKDNAGDEVAEAEPAQEAEQSGKKGKGKGKPKAKGTATVRRGVLEITRAVSLTPWPGDMTFNAASPRATASAEASKGAPGFEDWS